MKHTTQTASTRAKLGKYAFFLGSAATLVGRAGAQTAAQFTFDTSYSTGASGTTGSSTGGTSGMLVAEIGTGTAIGVHASAATVYSFPAGSASAKAFSSNNWTGGDYYQFTINATAFTSASVSFDMSRSATGPNGFVLQYSTNGGTSFTNFTTFSASSIALGTAATNGANSYSFDLSAVTALSNNATDVFRLTSDGTNSAGATTIAAAGTDRVDTFTFGPANAAGVLGAVPEPSTLALLSIAGAGAVTMAARRRKRA